MQNVNNEVVQEEQGITIKSLLYLCKRNLLLIILITLGCTLVAAVYGFRFKKVTYTATVTALCEADKSLGGGNEYSAYSYAVYLTNTFKDFITSDPVTDKAAIEMAKIKQQKGESYPSITSQGIKSATTISLSEYSVILKIEVKTSNEELSVDVANTLLECAIKAANEIDEQTGKQKYQTLADKLKLVNDAKTASGSRGALTVCLIGLAVGLVLSLAVIIIKFLTDDTYTSKEQFEKEYNINILATIPDCDSGGNK